jgi:beta-glucanase (GH16 family)
VNILKKLVIIKYIILTTILLFSIYIIFKKPEQRIYKVEVINKLEKNILVEDFNGKIDERYWNIIERGDNSNNELQYYMPKNVTINDSLLSIEAQKESINNHNYTSGMIDTKKKFEFLYGKIIFKAKPAIGKGLLSAIWLLPADDSFYPEMDIIEVLGENTKKIWTGLHYIDANNNQRRNFVSYNENSEISTYEFDWHENEIKMYVNNKLVYKTTTGVPNKKMYLTINLSVGGDWPQKVNDKTLPSKFLLDYIMIIPEAVEES